MYCCLQEQGFHYWGKWQETSQFLLPDFVELFVTKFIPSLASFKVYWEMSGESPVVSSFPKRHTSMIQAVESSTVDDFVFSGGTDRKVCDKLIGSVQLSKEEKKKKKKEKRKNQQFVKWSVTKQALISERTLESSISGILQNPQDPNLLLLR